MHRIDGADPGPGNSFVEGDPISGVPPTQITDDWLNAVQEEVAGVVEASGQILSKPNNAQLLAAINLLTRPSRLYRQGLINGDFGVWQRGSPIAYTVAQSKYAADRWLCTCGSGGAAAATLARAEQQASQRDLTGTRYALSWVQSAAAAPSTPPMLEQRIEDVTTFSGTRVVLSLWLKMTGLSSGTTATLNTEVEQNFGPSGSASVITSGPSIILTNGAALARFSVVIDVPSTAGKTYLGNTSHYLALRVKLPGTVTYAIDFMGAQLEAGSTPSAQMYRPEQLELELCCRYFERTYEHRWNGGAPTSLGAVTDLGSVKVWASTDARSLDRAFKVPKRAAPTMTWYSPATGASANIVFNGADRAVSATTAASLTSSGWPVTSSQAGSFAEAHWTADAEL
jgi:hypothetical protein